MQTEKTTEEDLRLIDLAFVSGNLGPVIQGTVEQFAKHGPGLLIIELTNISPTTAPATYWKPPHTIPDQDIKVMVETSHISKGTCAVALLYPNRLAAYQLALVVQYAGMPFKFVVTAEKTLIQG